MWRSDDGNEWTRSTLASSLLVLPKVTSSRDGNEQNEQDSEVITMQVNLIIFSNVVDLTNECTHGLFELLYLLLIREIAITPSVRLVLAFAN